MEQALSTPFADIIGARVIAAGDGSCTVSMDARDEHLNAADAVHGSVLAALVDITLSFAAGAHSDPAQQRFSITLSLTTNFLAAARKGQLTCRAWITGGGRRTVFCDGDIRDDDDRLIATATGTFKLVPYPNS